jgi:hypothetical protein
VSPENLSVRFKTRKKSAGACRRRVKASCGSGSAACRTVVYLSPGMECPNCHMATLEKADQGPVACPICGYGTHRPVT